MENIYFCIAISFLFIHELDAIKAKEWKLFIILRDLKEEQAYSIWLAMHLPVFLFPLLILSNFMDPYTILIYKIGLDIFLIFHLFLHFLFRNHKEYQFKSLQSNLYIAFTAIFAIFDLTFT
ncbi:DUF6713 family protein [Leptospira sp. WS58.C1]|uniref:DUF6713 family protein n=1 Tax=Leptospira cinconiae TaxID=3235173 RepID=UPI00349EB3BE